MGRVLYLAREDHAFGPKAKKERVEEVKVFGYYNSKGHLGSITHSGLGRNQKL